MDGWERVSRGGVVGRGLVDEGWVGNVSGGWSSGGRDLLHPNC